MALVVGPPPGTKWDGALRSYYICQDPQHNGSKDWGYSTTWSYAFDPEKLLVRVMVGRVLNLDRLESVLESVPLCEKAKKPSYYNKQWVKDALAALDEDMFAMGRRKLDWTTLKIHSAGYVGFKLSWDRWRTRQEFWGPCTPVYDLITGCEEVA